MRTTSGRSTDALARLGKLRMHQKGGRRAPHKPLLVLMALRRLLATGSSELLHGHELRPRSGTPPPDSGHVHWHTDQVFKGRPLATAATG
jgi:hypothetical protein